MEPINSKLKKNFFKFLATGFLVIISAGGFTQSIDSKDLLGKWQSTDKNMTIEFLDSSQLIMNAGQVKNMNLPYWIDKIQYQYILNIKMPTQFIIKLFLWKRNKDEIKVIVVDVINYKEPIKDNPKEKELKAIILKRLKDIPIT